MVKSYTAPIKNYKKTSTMVSINGENFWIHWVTNECVNIGYKGALFGITKSVIDDILNNFFLKKVILMLLICIVKMLTLL